MPRTRTLFVLGLLTLFAAGCDKRRFKIPASSMYPTLPLGSSVTADTHQKQPARGEIWVFHSPEHPDQEFVKRIVGIAGDRVEIHGDALSINGKPVPSCVVGAHTIAPDGTPMTGRLVLEKLDAIVYLVFLADDVTPAPSAGPWTLGAGETFAVGDNRHNSHDSRSFFGGLGGAVKAEHLIGRVETLDAALPEGASGLAAAFAKCKAEIGISP